jgi:SAM-dependent methyltransferase
LSGWWNLANRTGAPWDFVSPPDELVGLVDAKYLKPCRALDIGCGTGTSVTYLASKGFDAHGLDISKVAIRKALAKARAMDVRCDLRVMDFLDVKALSKLSTAFDLILDVGCFHSLSIEDRSKYKKSLNLVSAPRTKYLLWCFLRGSLLNYGPPGVDRDEAEITFATQFRVLEKRSLNRSSHEMLFYIMQREE